MAEGENTHIYREGGGGTLEELDSAAWYGRIGHGPIEHIQWNAQLAYQQFLLL